LVLPLTAKITQKHHLEIGGCNCTSLAAQFGTPLFILDKQTVVTKAQAYLEAFQDPELKTEVAYASKAFTAVAFCQLIKQLGLSLDVVSGGELYLALQAGFPPEKIYFHGNNKSEAELRLALENKVGQIVVDNFAELKLLQQLAAAYKVVVPVMLRLTPDVLPQTHQYIQTGQLDSKFGFPLTENLAFKAVKEIANSAFFSFKGVHVHIGSQIKVLSAYRAATQTAFKFLALLKKELNIEAAKLNLGGGLGIKYQANEAEPSVKELAQTILNTVKEEAKKHSLTYPEIVVEPGRSIVGQAGVTLYRVGALKNIPGIRSYVLVDGGMSDNLRPMLYGAKYEALVANKADLPLEEVVTIAGKHCESGDILIKDIKLPKIEVGDLICVLATGAYGYVLANNYNLQPRPGVVLVANGQAKVLIERESWPDLIKLHQLQLEENWQRV